MDVNNVQFRSGYANVCWLGLFLACKGSGEDSKSVSWRLKGSCETQYIQRILSALGKGEAQGWWCLNGSTLRLSLPLDLNSCSSVSFKLQAGCGDASLFCHLVPWVMMDVGQWQQQLLEQLCWAWYIYILAIHTSPLSSSGYVVRLKALRSSWLWVAVPLLYERSRCSHPQTGAPAAQRSSSWRADTAGWRRCRRSGSRCSFHLLCSKDLMRKSIQMHPICFFRPQRFTQCILVINSLFKETTF